VVDNDDFGDDQQRESNSIINVDDASGIYVRIIHGEVFAKDSVDNHFSKDDDNSSSSSSPPPATKRPKIQVESQRHLVIDIHTKDELSAQLVCCYPATTAITLVGSDDTIQSFDFLLTRGSQSAIGVALAWLEIHTGCVVAKLPFRPTVTDVAHAMALWTWDHVRQDTMVDSSGNNNENYTKRSKDENRWEGGNGAAAELAKRKPLTLTYAVPSELANAGLETISLTVPPIALLRLCHNMLQHQKNKNNGPINADFKPVPIVQGLQCFLKETFRLNIETFSLVHGSCGAAVLGCDGRCKPLSEHMVGKVLQEIQYMVQNQMPEVS